jgi:hypothetical protein
MILRRIGLSVGERPLLLSAGSRRVGRRGLSFMLSDNYDVDPAISARPDSVLLLAMGWYSP